MDELPATLEALAARERELLDILEPLNEQLNKVSKKKERRPFQKQMKPHFDLLEVIQGKIKDLKQAEQAEAENVKAGDTKPDASAPQPVTTTTDEHVEADDTKPDVVDAANEPDASAPQPDTTTTDVDVVGWDSQPTLADAPEEAPVEAPEETDFFDRPVDVDDTPRPLWIKDEIAPVEPKKGSPTDLAVIRFVADDKVYCVGQLDRSIKNNVIQVFPKIELSRSHLPCYTLRVKFPRDKDSESKTLFADPDFHTVRYNFLHNNYTVEDHLVIDATEFQEFLLHAPTNVHSKAKEAMSQGKLYRITLSFDDNKIEQNFYPNVYSSKVPEIQEIFDAMVLVPTAKSISVFQWMYKDLPGNLQYMYNAQRELIPPLQQYLHKHNAGLAAYVQWGKLLVPENEPAFEVSRTFHAYSDYNLINGNAIAREKLKELDLIKKVRNHRVKMTITPAGDGDNFYIGFLQFREYQEAKKLIYDAGQGLVTWDPTPIVKPQKELADGERPAQDIPHGWRAWVITDGTIEHGADIMVFLARPTEPWNKSREKIMPGPAKEGDVLPSQLVYYKIAAEVKTTKELISGLAKLRPKETQGNPAAQIKRAIICGRDHTKYKTVDIFDGLSDAEIADSKTDLTPSQEDFVFSYCRQIFNGIGLLQGPAGSGKTTVIKSLLQIAKKRQVKLAIVTEANSMSDNVVEVIGDKSNIVVRLHSLGLEERHLWDYGRHEGEATLLPADPEPQDPDEEQDKGIFDKFKYSGVSKDRAAPVSDEASEPTEVEENDEVDGWKDDELSIVFTDIMLKAARRTYENAQKIMSPDDPRMILINSALWTWMLKVMGMVHDENESKAITDTLQKLSKDPIWKELRSYLLKSETQLLNNAETKKYHSYVRACATMFIAKAADTTVCTFAQLANEWAKDVNFEWVIVDEATKMNEPQMIQIWRESADLVLMIGDQAQLGPTTLSKGQENPFVKQLAFSPFQRFLDNGYPYMMLREVMRSTAGLETMCSDVFYSSQLKPGIRTSLEDRPLSSVWQKQMQVKYPDLKPEPQGLVYPVFISTTSESASEMQGGTSRINKKNMAAVMNHLLWIVCDAKIVEPGEIGIVAPYAGQVEGYRAIMKQMPEQEPGYMWSALRIGTTEWFQGREAPYMIVDLVRGSNDHGDLGFVSEGRRLNVLFSRQKEALVIFGDKDCVTYLETGDQTEDLKISKTREERNRNLTKVFTWLEAHGRYVILPADATSNKYVTIETTEPEAANSGFDNVEIDLGAADGW